ncbi:MAG: hypothetical protein AMXMBFR19_05480 [Chthonomonadaceae bacterium]|uniref:Uncharacterized protein n=1 Tax=Candidatus Nitrosymbiomonas proteolyticus TaxID=2608984 RepID=A0A809S913_9BACT|nr:conserved hypothetical protein [Candidatus Nitrosymbiomonas proteolyticus]
MGRYLSRTAAVPAFSYNGVVTGQPLWTKLAASIVLAGLTLAVFATLQDYGPESAVRRFHEAALNGDSRAMGRVVTSDSSEGAVSLLASRVLELARSGGRYQLLGIERGPGSARAEVAYVFPYRGLVISMLWSVRKEGRSWRVDADETLRNLPRAVGVSSLDELTH